MSRTTASETVPEEQPVRDEPGASRRSANTWASSDPNHGLPAGLLVRPGQPWSGRLAGLRGRHRLRGERARVFYAESRNPERGLPVAGNVAAWTFVKRLLSVRKGMVAVVMGTNLAAAMVGLIVPRMLGDLIDQVTGGAASVTAVDSIVTGLIVVVLVQSALVFAARRASAVLGYDLLAAAREEIVGIVLRLPLGRVESASSGDLLTRITSDVSKMSQSVRWAFPQLVMSLVLVVASLVALVLNSAFLAMAMIGSLFVLWFATRHYLKYAGAGYIAESGTYSQINSTTTETVEGARTVEALDLGPRRIAIGDDDIAESNQAERYTMTLRNLFFIFLDISYQLPLVGVVLLGTVGYTQGWVTLGQITTAAIYVQGLVEPMDRLIQVFDTLQVGLAATTRLLGVAEVPEDRTAGDDLPEGTDVVGSDLRFAYRPGTDVLHGIDLDLRPVELDDQDGHRPGRVAAVHGRLGRLDGEGVHHLDGGGQDTGGDDRGHGIRGVRHAPEGGEERARRLGLAQQAQGHLGHDAEQALAADDDAEDHGDDDRHVEVMGLVELFRGLGSASERQ